MTYTKLINLKELLKKELDTDYRTADEMNWEYKQYQQEREELDMQEQIKAEKRAEYLAEQGLKEVMHNGYKVITPIISEEDQQAKDLINNAIKQKEKLIND